MKVVSISSAKRKNVTKSQSNKNIRGLKSSTQLLSEAFKSLRKIK